MYKIALGSKVYSVLGMTSFMFSETPRGALLAKASDFKDEEYTKIDFAVDIDVVGIAIFPTPLKDVIEYFQMEKDAGNVPEFKMKFVTRKATEKENTVIQDIIKKKRERGPKKRPALIRRIV